MGDADRPCGDNRLCTSFRCRKDRDRCDRPCRRGCESDPAGFGSECRRWPLVAGWRCPTTNPATHARRRTRPRWSPRNPRPIARYETRSPSSVRRWTPTCVQTASCLRVCTPPWDPSVHSRRDRRCSSNGPSPRGGLSRRCRRSAATGCAPSAASRGDTDLQRRCSASVRVAGCSYRPGDLPATRSADCSSSIGSMTSPRRCRRRLAERFRRRQRRQRTRRLCHELPAARFRPALGCAGCIRPTGRGVHRVACCGRRPRRSRRRNAREPRTAGRGDRRGDAARCPRRSDRCRPSPGTAIPSGRTPWRRVRKPGPRTERERPRRLPRERSPAQTCFAPRRALAWWRSRDPASRFRQRGRTRAKASRAFSRRNSSTRSRPCFLRSRSRRFSPQL